MQPKNPKTQDISKDRKKQPISQQVTDSDHDFNTPHKAALLLHEAGFFVSPLAPRSKVPIKDWNLERCLQGIPDEDERQKWFDTYCKQGSRYYNWSLICGKIHGLIVIDADTLESKTWCDDNLLTPYRTLTTRGCHYYYAYSEKIGELDLSKSKGLPEIGIDIKSSGYVVAPGSIHPTTDNPYQYIGQPIGSIFDLPELSIEESKAIVELIRSQVGISSERTPTGRKIESIGKSVEELFINGSAIGGRNNAVVRITGALARTGHDKTTAIPILLEWNKRNTPPLERKELTKTVRSTFKTIKEQQKRRNQALENILYKLNERPLEESEKLIERLANDFFHGDSFPKFSVARVTTGSGKTTGFIDATKHIFEKRILFLTPDKNLASAIHSQLEDAVLVTGRSSENCVKFDEMGGNQTIRGILNATGSIYRSICDQEPPKNSPSQLRYRTNPNLFRCRNYSKCKYIKQRKAAGLAQIVVGTHDQLFLPDNQKISIGSFDFIIIDETIYSKYAVERRIYANTLDKYIEGIYQMVDQIENDSSIETLDSAQKLAEITKEALEKKSLDDLIKFCLLNFEDLKEKLNELTKISLSRYNGITPWKNPSELKIMFQNHVFNKLPLIKKMLVLCAENKGVSIQEHKERFISLEYRSKSQIEKLLEDQGRLIVLDASANQVLYKKIYPDCGFHSIESSQNLTVIQCEDLSFSKTSLLHTFQRESELKSQNQRWNTIKKTIDVVRNAGLKTVVFTYKDVISTERFQEITSEIDSIHFGGFRGSNDFENHQCAIIIGRNQPAVAAVESINRSLTFDVPGIERKEIGGSNFTKRKTTVVSENPELMRDLRNSCHPDELTNSILSCIREEESMQAIGRLRAVRSKQKKLVILLSNLVLPINVDFLTKSNKIPSLVKSALEFSDIVENKNTVKKQQKLA